MYRNRYVQSANGVFHMADESASHLRYCRPVNLLAAAAARCSACQCAGHGPAAASAAAVRSGPPGRTGPMSHWHTEPGDSESRHLTVGLFMEHHLNQENQTRTQSVLAISSSGSDLPEQQHLSHRNSLRRLIWVGQEVDAH